MHDIKAIRSCDISAQWPPRPHSRVRRMRGPASPAPSALRPRSPSRRCAKRSAVVDTSPATHSTSPFAHTRAHDIRSARAHKHTCTLTHSTLSFFASLCHSARACMDGCTRATPPRSGVETGLPHSPVQPFQPSFVRISNPFSAAFFFRTFKFLPKVASPSSFGDSVPRHDEPTSGSASGAIEALALEWMRHLINVVTPALLRLPSAWRSNLGNFLHRVASPASPVCVTRCVQLAQTRNS